MLSARVILRELLIVEVSDHDPRNPNRYGFSLPTCDAADE